MNLIGSNKIANYILEHPQSRVVLLTFLKEFPYRHELYKDSDDLVNGTFQTDGFDCLIKVRINCFAKAITILELTTAEEERNKWEQKRKEQETIEIREEVITKSVTIVVTAPPLPDIEYQDLEKINNNEVVANLFHPEMKDLAIGTVDEYEQNLYRANILFDAQPEAPEFEELLNLLPKVIEYETYKLEFPKLKIFEVVKHRIELFSITPFELRYIIGTDDQVDLFFSGNLELADDVLGKLYEIVALRAPVTDKRFL